MSVLLFAVKSHRQSNWKRILLCFFIFQDFIGLKFAFVVLKLSLGLFCEWLIWLIEIIRISRCVHVCSCSFPPWPLKRFLLQIIHQWCKTKFLLIAWVSFPSRLTQGFSIIYQVGLYMRACSTSLSFWRINVWWHLVSFFIVDVRPSLMTYREWYTKWEEHYSFQAPCPMWRTWAASHR